MAKLVSNSTANAILDTINTVRNMQTRPRQETRRRIRTGGSGDGGSLVWGTSPTATYPNGATASEPGEDLTALNNGTFYIATPWGTREASPDDLFAYWNKKGDNYYLYLFEFYIQPQESYPSGAGQGIEDFNVYLNKSATHSLGDDTDFPAGIKAISNTFDNENASTDSLDWFDTRIIKSTYDSENNTIYMDNPQF